MLPARPWRNWRPNMRSAKPRSSGHYRALSIWRRETSRRKIDYAHDVSFPRIRTLPGATATRFQVAAVQGAATAEVHGPRVRHRGCGGLGRELHVMQCRSIRLCPTIGCIESQGGHLHQSGQVRWVLLTAGVNERLEIALVAARPARLTQSMVLAPVCPSRTAQPRKAITPIQGKPESQTTAKLRVRVAN